MRNLAELQTRSPPNLSPTLLSPFKIVLLRSERGTDPPINSKGLEGRTAGV